MVRVCFVCATLYRRVKYSRQASRIKCDNNLQIYVLARVEMVTDNNTATTGTMMMVQGWMEEVVIERVQERVYREYIRKHIE